MTRTERVKNISTALLNVTEAISSAIDELELSMTNKVTSIAKLKKELQADNEEFMDLTTVIETFANDLSEVANDMDNATTQILHTLNTLEDFPNELIFVDDDDED